MKKLFQTPPAAGYHDIVDVEPPSSGWKGKGKATEGRQSTPKTAAIFIPRVNPNLFC